MKKVYAALASFLMIAGANAQNALNFDGVNDRVSCGNNSSVQLSGTKITLEAWIYPTAWQTNVWQGNIINKENNSPDYGYMLRCGNGGKLNFNLGNGSWKEITSSANVLTLNTWQHVAATYDGSKMRLYVNGVRTDSLSTSVTFSSPNKDLTVGNWADVSSNRTFIGTIDEARVWNVRRTRSEILSAMNGEFCAPPAGLVACYRLNEGIASSGNTGVTLADDFSPNGNDGTLSGFTLSGSTSNWVNGSGITPGSNFMKVTATGCNTYRSPRGNTYDSTGVYLDTLQNIHGCDSVIETTLTMKHVDISVIATSTTLSANQPNGVYRWMDCNDNYRYVTGGTQQNFTPPDPYGSYAVSVNYSGCLDTSACYSLQGVSLNESDFDKFKIFPNPSSGEITVSHRYQGIIDIAILNLEGKVIYQLNGNNGHEIKLDLSGLPKGIYLIQLRSDDSSSVQRFILE